MWIPAAIGAVGSVVSAIGKDDPPVPDYKATAEEQAEQARLLAEAQARINRPNVNTPQGSMTWEETQRGNPAYLEAMARLAAIPQTVKGVGGIKLPNPEYEKAKAALDAIPKTTPSWEQNITLSPEQQAIYDAQTKTAIGRNELANSMLPQARAALGTGINYGALPAAGGSLQARDLATGLDFSGAPALSTGDEARNRAEQSIYERATSRLDPQFKEQENELRTRLYNQGLREGDAAFDAEIAKFQTAKTDAYQTALNSAIQGGGQEASRTFGMDLSARQQSVGETTDQARFMNQAAAQGLSQDQAISAYQNMLRQNALSEQQGARSQAINEMNALQSGQQVSMPDFPGFSPASAGSTPDLMGAANAQYGADLASYNAGQKESENLWGAAAELTPYLFDYGGKKKDDPYSYGTAPKLM